VVVWRRRLTPGARGAGGVFVKDLWIRFIEGFSKEPKEPLWPRGEFRTILCGSQTEGWGSAKIHDPAVERNMR
jgi:hypothetical protein